MPSITTAPRRKNRPSQAGGPKRAVLYLRVSTKSQVNTDYDPEGLSIPAQRRACEAKANQMGIEIVGQYVEPGRSATSMDKRVEFQAMLERIRKEGDIDYVLVYKLSRMNRNRVDDAIVLMTLRQYNVSLISATEHIDDSPEGQLMHGILAAMNEFRSRGDGADIAYKMSEKARKGGTLGKAPLGYLNVRQRVDGHEIRTVAIDPERGPLIKLAFDLYATGDYTLERLANTLNDRGLVTKGGRYPAAPISTSKLHVVLRNRYYLGYVTYQGEEIKGRHESLIDPDVFDRVQEVMATRSGQGVRQRIYNHYLKGLLWCGACHDDGRESRMIVQRANGRGGGYFYFFCKAKQTRLCTTRYLDMDDVEEAVADEYHRLQVSPEFASWLRAEMTEALDESERSVKLRRDDLTVQITRLRGQEERLLDLVADGKTPRTAARDRLTEIARQRESLEAEAEAITSRITDGAAHLATALDLLADPYELYRRFEPAKRRLLNRAIFKRVYIYERQVSDRVYHEPFSLLVPLAEAFENPSSPGSAETVPPGEEGSWAAPALRAYCPAGTGNQPVVGWSKRTLVEKTMSYSNPAELRERLTPLRQSGAIGSCSSDPRRDERCQAGGVD